MAVTSASCANGANTATMLTKLTLLMGVTSLTCWGILGGDKWMVGVALPQRCPATVGWDAIISGNPASKHNLKHSNNPELQASL